MFVVMGLILLALKSARTRTIKSSGNRIKMGAFKNQAGESIAGFKKTPCFDRERIAKWKRIPEISPEFEQITVAPGKTSIRCYALSDLHADSEKNQVWVRDNCVRKLEEADVYTVFVLPGDVGSEIDQILKVLSHLVEEYDAVCYVPGNHEAWRRGMPTSTCASPVSTLSTHTNAAESNEVISNSGILQSNTKNSPAEGEPAVVAVKQSTAAASISTNRAAPTTDTDNSAYNTNAGAETTTAAAAAVENDISESKRPQSVSGGDENGVEEVKQESGGYNATAQFVVGRRGADARLAADSIQKLAVLKRAVEEIGVKTGPIRVSLSPNTLNFPSSPMTVLNDLHYTIQGEKDSIAQERKEARESGGGRTTGVDIAKDKGFCGTGLVVIPLYSWYHYSWDTEPEITHPFFLEVEKVIPFVKKWGDFSMCLWPDTLVSREDFVTISNEGDTNTDAAAVDSASSSSPFSRSTPPFSPALSSASPLSSLQRDRARALSSSSTTTLTTEGSAGSAAPEFRNLALAESFASINEPFLPPPLIHSLIPPSTTTTPTPTSAPTASPPQLLLRSLSQKDVDPTTASSEPPAERREHREQLRRSSTKERPGVENYRTIDRFDDSEESDETDEKGIISPVFGCPIAQSEDTIISFSHFLPRVELSLEKRYLTEPFLSKVVGSDVLESQIRRLLPHLHLFGHTHVPIDLELDGLRYVQWPLGYSRERRRQCFPVASTGPLLVYDSALIDRSTNKSDACNPDAESRASDPAIGRGNTKLDTKTTTVSATRAATTTTTTTTSSAQREKAHGIVENMRSKDTFWSQFYRNTPRMPWNTDDLAPWVVQRLETFSGMVYSARKREEDNGLSGD